MDQNLIAEKLESIGSPRSRSRQAIRQARNHPPIKASSSIRYLSKRDSSWRHATNVSGGSRVTPWRNAANSRTAFPRCLLATRGPGGYLSKEECTVWVTRRL